MDARVLIFIFDLGATFVHIDIHAHENSAFLFHQRIAQTTTGNREITARCSSGIEMLMEHHIRRGEHGAVLPVDAGEIVFSIIPKQ